MLLSLYISFGVGVISVQYTVTRANVSAKNQTNPQPDGASGNETLDQHAAFLQDINPDLLISNDTVMDLNDAVPSEEDETRAAEMGIPSKTFKTVKELLKTTAGIDIGAKQDTETVNSNKGSGDAGVQEDGEDSKGRYERDTVCPDSPPGVAGQCLPCDPTRDTVWSEKARFEHRDENGYTCMCDMCAKLTYMKTPCTCTDDGQVKDEPTCEFAVEGESFMPYRNWCSKPYPCSTCPGDLIQRTKCTLDADLGCECPERTDQVDNSRCIPWPPCQENHGIKLDMTAVGSRHVCKPCDDGFIQPKNNSYERCIYQESTTNAMIATQEDYTKDSNEPQEPTYAPGRESTVSGKVGGPTEDDFNLLTSPSLDSPDESIIPKLNRILDPISVAILWIITIVIAFLLGVLCQPCISTKYTKWCNRQNGRKHHRHSDAYYNEASSHVVNMNSRSKSSKNGKRFLRSRKQQTEKQQTWV